MSKTNHKIYLSLGSNIGDREKTLIGAVREMCDIKDTYLDNISNIYETKPVGYTSQGDFLNMAVSFYTSLEAENFLYETQRIENLFGRVRSEIHWGPRTMDIDILLYDDLKIKMPQLVIPHPRMFERAFVLIPLKEIYPQKMFFDVDIDKAIDKCQDRKDIRLYRDTKSCNLCRI
ncbi:MAG: 2-amino-4-hydroxy-6-hydroxymethyldihydropteridine diphosphokinase [Clostridium sp.]|nr:2-amino-4-hydroxy-6-hydroxymethyldihydropteridine diphosphokinase [Clostridium sp.]